MKVNCQFLRILSLLLLTTSRLLAADEPPRGLLKGRVLSADGKAAELVSIRLKETALGTLTDGQGRFTLKAPAGEYVLLASIVGYQPQERLVRIESGVTTTLEPVQLLETSAQLSEIIVKSGAGQSYAEKVTALATRLATPLRDVPQSVQILNRQLLLDRNVQTVGEAVKMMVGVNAFSSGQYSDYTLRGFRSSPGNFAYNGIRGDFYQFDQGALTYNLERIEAIKGPASVLFSAGNPGGVINHVTKRAQAAPRYEAELTVGSFNQYRAMLDATGAVSPNKKLLYRAVLGYENTGQLDHNQKIQNVFFAPQLQYNFSEKTVLNYELNYSNDHRTMGFQRGVPALNVGETQWQLDRFPADFSMIDPRGFSKTRAVSNQLQFSHAFNEKLKINVLFRSMHTRQRQFDVSPGGFSEGAVRDSIPMSHGFWKPDYSAYQSTTYLNWDFNTGRVKHQTVFGLDLTSDGRTYGYATLAEQRVYLPNPDFSWARYDDSPAAIQAAVDAGLYASGTTERTRLLAAYFQDQITISEKVKALVGGRIEQHRYRNRTFGLVNGETTGGDSLRAVAFSPRAGLVYQPSRTVSLYASYTQGFQPQYGSNRGGGGPFPPEKSRQYEVGTKTEWFGGKLLASVAVYYIQKYDVLSPDPTDADGLRLIQIGNVVSKGVEVSLQGQVTPRLSVIANYAYNEATTPGDAGFDYNNPGWFPNAPNHNANAWATYRLPLGLKVGLGFNHLSERSTFVPGFEIPSYTTVDASLGYERRGFRANLTLNNLSDTRYWYGVYGPANLWPGNPRSFRLTVGYVL